MCKERIASIKMKFHALEKPDGIRVVEKNIAVQHGWDGGGELILII